MITPRQKVLLQIAMGTLVAANVTMLALLFAKRRFAGPGGDESFFLRMVEQFRDQPYQTMASGCSVPYAGIGAALSAIGLPTLNTLRALSLVCIPFILGGIFFLARNLIGLSRMGCWLAGLTGLNALTGSIYFNYAISDPLHIAILIWLFVLLLVMLKDNNNGIRFPVYCGLLTALALATRPSTILYFPGILAIIVIAAFVGRTVIPLKKGLVAFFVGSIILILLQLPPIWEHHGFRFENKNPSETLTWSQQNYLTMLMRKGGSITSPQRSSWADTRRYLEEHGSNSLPTNELETIVFDPNAVAKASLMHFFIQEPYVLLRRCGFLFVAVLVGALSFVILRLRNMRQFSPWEQLVVLVLAFLIALSGVILLDIEWRWMIPAVLLVNVIGMKCIENLKTGQHTRLYWSVVVGQLLFLTVSKGYDFWSIVGMKF